MIRDDLGWLKSSMQMKLIEIVYSRTLALNPLTLISLRKNLPKFVIKTKSPVKSLLMNANLIVGIGNIYASEALYRAGILPTRPANTLTHSELEKLHRKNHCLFLTEAIESGGSTLRDYIRSDGQSGYFQHNFKVYSKNGKECQKCNELIKKIVMSGRATYLCPHCQK